jgi:N-acyl amino acid synthase of PEP-CTERM/exosortase system
MRDMPVNFFELSDLYTNHFDVVRADTPALLKRVYEIRYQVYCVENPFLPVQNRYGREIDDDDNRAAHLLLIHRHSGEFVGTTRVIFPENARPLPIQHTLDLDGQRVFRQFPRQTTGEVSRFAICKSFRQRRGEERYADIGSNSSQTRLSSAEQRAMPFLTFGLLRGIISTCLETGITHVAAVMEPTLIRLFKRFGIHFQLAGGLVEHHGVRQPCMTRIGDVIDDARSQDSLFWRYIKDEVSRHIDHSLDRVLARSASGKP